MDKYIRITFKDAGIFKNHGKSKDKLYDLLATSHLKRKDTKQFEEPITTHQIANALHVLFGERPVPTFRTVIYDSVEYLVNKANDSYLKVNPLTRKLKSGEERMVGETISTNKAAWNSFNPVATMNWHKVKLFLEEYYNQFTDLLVSEYGEDILKDNFINVAEMLKEKCSDTILDFLLLLNKKGKKPVYDYIFLDGNAKANINKNKRVLDTVSNGIDTIYRLSGEILVPVSDEDLVTLSNGSGFATFLDGGYLKIEEVLDANRLSIDDYRKVSTISTKMS